MSTIVSGIFNSTRPGYWQNGVARDTRTSVNSAPITGSQTLLTVTASAPFFAPSDVGRFIKFLTGEVALIGGFISSTVVSVTPSQTVLATTFLSQGFTVGGNFGQVNVGNKSGILGLLESIAGDGDEDFVWFDTGAGDFRDLGSFQNGLIADIDDAGYLLVGINPTSSQFKTLIYNPNTNLFADQGLPATFGGTVAQSTPVAMNASHQVAISGDSWVGSDLDPNNHRVHALLGLAGVLTDIHPAAANNPSISGATSACSAINALGHVAGQYVRPGDGIQRAFFYNGITSVDLGFAAEVDLTAITCLNDSDTLVGSADNGVGTFLPFKWTPGGGGVFLPLLPATTSGNAIAINAAGWIVGTMSGKAFLYRNGATENLLTTIAALDPLWTNIPFVSFVNNSKQICGQGVHSGLFKTFLLTLV